MAFLLDCSHLAMVSDYEGGMSRLPASAGSLCIAANCKRLLTARRCSRGHYHYTGNQTPLSRSQRTRGSCTVCSESRTAHGWVQALQRLQRTRSAQTLPRCAIPTHDGNCAGTFPRGNSGHLCNINQSTTPPIISKFHYKAIKALCKSYNVTEM